MAQKQTEIDITDKHEVVLLHGVNQGRRTILATLDPPGGYNTIYWESEELRDKYHKSVAAFLFAEEITVTTTLMKGQKPDAISPKAPSVGSTTGATARTMPLTGSAAGHGSTCRRCSWTRCSAARVSCGPWL